MFGSSTPQAVVNGFAQTNVWNRLSQDQIHGHFIHGAQRGKKILCGFLQASCFSKCDLVFGMVI